MNNFEFLNYFPTPEEQYFMGIATIRIYGKIILKYKVVQKKEGGGYFIAAPSYKLPVNEDGSYKYVNAFQVDSTMENDDLISFIRTNVNQAMSPGQTRQEPQQPQQAQQPQQQPKTPQQQQFTQPDLNSCPF